MSKLDKFTEYYQALNREQQQIVDFIEGSLLVIAGPGSGKTQVLSLRVANILKQTDTLASSILCLTFTEAAALNMQQRLFKIIGLEAFKVCIQTFHGFANQVINQYPEYFFEGGDFVTAGDLERLEILQEIFQNLPLRDPLSSFLPGQGWVYLRDCLSKIGELKKAGLTPTDFKNILQQNQTFAELIKPELIKLNEFEKQKPKKQPKISFYQNLKENIQALCNQKNLWVSTTKTVPLAQVMVDSLSQALCKAKNDNSTKPLTSWKHAFMKNDNQRRSVLKDSLDMGKYLSLAKIYEEYLEKMRLKQLYDFKDMLLEFDLALKKYPSLRYDLQEKYLYFLVDEFQDTSGVQSDILNQLADSEVAEGNPNLMVVGDDDQAIYKFQGANLTNILNFKNKCQKTIILTKNYRSNQSILDFASKVIDTCENRLSHSIGIDKVLVSQR